MKYLVVLGDGMADRPLEELGGRTPLEAAETPNFDMLAAKSTISPEATSPIYRCWAMTRRCTIREGAPWKH